MIIWDGNLTASNLNKYRGAGTQGDLGETPIFLMLMFLDETHFSAIALEG